MEHISHFNQKMAVHANNEALIGKVFPSSLGLVAMRWFDALEEGSVGVFKELTRAFGARFIMCSKVPKPVDSLLSMVMREGETLKTYSNRYWETYNEIDGNFKDVVVRTFKVSLPTEHELRKLLSMKSALNMRQLLDRIDKYKQVDETRYKERVRLKCSQRRRILGEVDIRVIALEGSFLIKRYPRELNWSIHCLKSQCIRYWRKLRVSLISSGPIRWMGTHPGEIRASIATTIRIEDIL